MASTQSTQYNGIGTAYKAMHDLPVSQPERPSVIATLGDIKGAKCLDLACGLGRYTSLLHSLGASSVTGFDISSAMIAGAQSSYPPSTYPTLRFHVADCSKPLPALEPTEPQPPYDIVFGSWFLNYAGSERELEAMLKVIEQNLKPSGRFVGIIPNPFSIDRKIGKKNWYEMDVTPVESEWRDPDTNKVIGAKVKVLAHAEPPIEFQAYRLDPEVFERCAAKVGLKLAWKKPVRPTDEKWAEGKGVPEGYWDKYMESPTFIILEAVKIALS